MATSRDIALMLSNADGEAQLKIKDHIYDVHVDTIDIRSCDHQLSSEIAIRCVMGVPAIPRDMRTYVKYDINSTLAMINKRNQVPKIKNVIFNDPATIVFWSDGTKTVVKKGEGDTFDPEKGLAMAFMKRMLGNTGSYFNEVKKWVKEN